MSQGSWQLQSPHASLRGALAGSIDLNAPQAGLARVSCSGAVVTERLLGVGIVATATGTNARASSGVQLSAPGNLCDAFIREDGSGNDLIAVYDTQDHRHLRVQIYWRAVPSEQLPADAAAIDLIVSVQTDLLDDCPRIEATSRIAAKPIESLSARDTQAEVPSSSTARWFTLGDSPSTQQHASRALQYVQMVQDADATHEHETSETSPAGELEIRQVLFDQPLEKGVIRRARMRALWLPASDSAQATREQILAAFQTFVEAPLPLTA